jgi:hypothetical protein
MISLLTVYTNYDKLEKRNNYIIESMNEKTTWGSNKYNEKHTVFYKYDKQLNNMFNAITLSK